MTKYQTFKKIAGISFMTACLAGAAFYYAPPYEGNVGITFGEAYAPLRETSLDFHLWYPAKPGGREMTVGGNGVFYGTKAGRGAPRLEGRFPLIVMSHGSGGNAGQFGWIASKLADAGFVVAIPNHPGTTTGNASAERAVRVWERPPDLSAVIDAIEADPEKYEFVDTSKIMTLGFSAGGYTSMAVSGARVDSDALQRFCDVSDHGMSDCAFLANAGIDLHEIDMSPASQDHTDPRIKAAVIVDPGIISTITTGSMARIGIPMLIINLGDEDKVPAGVYARRAAETVPTAQYRIVPDATHFSFLAECKPRGPQILVDEGEPDPLCEDAGGRPRAEIHHELSEIIVAYFQGIV